MFFFRNLTVQKMVRTALVAALYAALTLLIQPIAYGDVQFRLTEVMVLLCFYSPEYCLAMVLGCAIANLFSTLGYIDVLVGSLATLLAVIPMYKTRRLWLASLFPVLTNGLLVGLELSLIFEAPFWLMALSVAAGEFVVVCLVGVPLFKLVLERRRGFMKLIAPGCTKLSYIKSK